MKTIILVLLLAVTYIGSVQARVHHMPRTIAVPSFSAKSYLIADANGQIIKEQDGETVRPIASISKLLLSLLVSEQDLNEMLSLPTTRTVHSVIPKKVSGLSRKELLTLALVHSDNFAAQILCDNLSNCVRLMNEKAQEIGMTNTHYSEPTGLSSENVSTAHDLLKLLMVASTNQTITELSSLPKAEIDVGKQVIKVNNTNPLTSRFEVILSKTGFTGPAGGCLVMIMNSSVGERILILLGSRNVKTRILDTEKLIKEF